MATKHLVWIIVLALCCPRGLFAQAQQSQPNPKVVQENKAKVAKMVGKKVTVRTVDDRVIRGRLTRITDDGFVVVDEKSKNDVTVNYSDAKKVNGPMRLPIKIAIWSGVVTALVASGIYAGLRSE